jgi:hypothetical protein
MYVFRTYFCFYYLHSSYNRFTVFGMKGHRINLEVPQAMWDDGFVQAEGAVALLEV